MKKILIFFMVGVVMLLGIGCNSKKNEVQPPTGFKIVAISDSLGTAYDVKVLLEKDTTWVYPRIKNDTLKDAAGKPLRDKDNKLIINSDTTYTPGKITGKYFLLDTILLPHLEGIKRNKLYVDIESNARWQAPYNPKWDWVIPVNSTGGGDSRATFNIAEAGSQRRSWSKRYTPAVQNFFTRDSLVLYKLIIDQKGYNEKKP